MTKEDHPPQVVVIMPYHNNLYDFLLVLARIGSVSMLTPRSFKKETHLTPLVSTQKIIGAAQFGPVTHAYNPFKLWKMIDPETTHVIIKHLDLVENITPAVIAFMRGIKIIVMVQQVNQNFFRRILVLLAAWYARMVGAAIFSVTRSGQEALKKVIPGLHYIPACIDPSRFTLASLHHKKPETLRIIAIGKYIERKNFGSLLEAVSIVRSKMPNVPLQITLVGPVSDASVHSAILQKVTNDPLLRSNVEVKGAVPPREIPALLASHNLFILPAASEPLGYSVLEAMAAGLPVITTHEVGSASYVENKKNGFIIEDIKPTSLATAIEAFIGDSYTINTVMLRNFGQYSRLLVERFHTPNAIMGDVQKLLS